MEILIRYLDDKGQTTVEYVLVVLFIVMVIVLAFKSADVGQSINIAASNIENNITVTE